MVEKGEPVEGTEPLSVEGTNPSPVVGTEPSPDLSDTPVPAEDPDSSVYESSDEETPEADPSTTEPSEPAILHKHQVKMQRLAKKRRLFLIQKITRRLKGLKAKKGNEQQLSKNARKCARLVEKISDLKVLNVETFISEMVSSNFAKPSETVTTTDWFKNELFLDRFSFMAFVNPLIGLPVEYKPRIKKHIHLNHPKAVAAQQAAAEGADPPLFTSSLSSYREEDDNILTDILKEKRNRPGQRARQKKWEEQYGIEAKHLVKPKFTKPGKSDQKPDQKDFKKEFKEKKEGKRKRTEVQPQEIMKKLKAEAKEAAPEKKEQKEHPSWAAKKLQSSQSTKIDVFAGTKITFSDDE